MPLPKLPSPPRSTGNEELDRWALALFQYVKALGSVDEGDPVTVPADLTGGSSTDLHYHSSDRARANHTGYQSASTISNLESFVRGLGIGSDHAILNSLAWTSSGHTGTASTVAGFTAAGVATEYALPWGVTNGGTGRATSTTAYGLLAAGTTATGVHQTLAAGATTEILVGGGASALPVWTTATGTGAPVRQTAAAVGGVWTANSAWTLPAFTLGGTVTLNGQTFSGAAAFSAGATFGGALSGITDLTTTGNTILGNAQGDTLNVGNGDIVKDASGNTGLGITPVPHNGGSRVLHIEGGAAGAELRLTNTATGSASGSGCLNSLIGSDYYLYNLENAFMSFGTNSLERVRIPAAGGLTLYSAAAIGRDADNSLLLLRGGSTASDGGQLELYGNSHATIPGNFILSAVDGTGHSLQGTPAGLLTWSGGVFNNTGVFYGPNGSTSAPTYSFSSGGSDNTGMYLSNTDELSFATNGGQRLKIASTGLATFKGGVVSDLGAGGGIGYTTGAGSTQTQGTSKSTTVVLNTPTGEITMHNATLNGDTTVSFTFTNSSIANTDLLLLNHSSAGTAGAYLLNAQCGSGSATINVRNITTGNLGEAIVIRYALIKGATS